VDARPSASFDALVQVVVQRGQIFAHLAVVFGGVRPVSDLAEPLREGQNCLAVELCLVALYM